MTGMATVVDMPIHCGRVHKGALIDLESLFEPLVAEFFPANIQYAIDVGVDQLTAPLLADVGN